MGMRPTMAWLATTEPARRSTPTRVLGRIATFARTVHWRRLRRLALSTSCTVVVAGAGLIGASGGRPVGDDVASGWALAAWGPFDPADRDLLIQMRLASVWGRQAGRLPLARASSPTVIDAGEKIANELDELDGVLLSVAAELRVLLPEQPNADQRRWSAEIAVARGAEFDRVFVDRLRAEYGRLFSVIAGVRAGTRNELIRSLAVTANGAVLRHMTYLESTGLVNFVTLPLPSVPGEEGRAEALTETDTGPLAAADRDLLVRMRLASLWQQTAAAHAQDHATGTYVKDVAKTTADEQAAQSQIVSSLAVALDVSLPDQPNTEQRGWLAEIAAARGEEFDRIFVNRLRG